MLAFLFVKGLTQAYFVKPSMTYNKYLTPVCLEDNKSISA